MFNFTDWFINLVPLWVPIGIIITSVVAFIASYFVGILSTLYKELIKVVSIMAFAFGFYFFGCLQYANHVKIETQKEIQYVDRVVTQQQVITNTVVKWYKQNQTKIGDNYVNIRKEITPVDDDKCVIPQSFIRVHDDAAKGSVSNTTSGVDGTAAEPSTIVSPTPIKFSDVEDTITINYEEYHKIADQLIQLQNWVSHEKKANP